MERLLRVNGVEPCAFPLGNGRALAAEIPGARLLTVPGMGNGLPRRAWDTVVPAVLQHTSPTNRP